MSAGRDGRIDPWHWPPPATTHDALQQCSRSAKTEILLRRGYSPRCADAAPKAPFGNTWRTFCFDRIATRTPEPLMQDADNSIELVALNGIPLIHAGDDLVSVVLDALARMKRTFETGDILVIAQKIVSKSQGRLVRLDTVEPSQRAMEI